MNIYSQRLSDFRVLSHGTEAEVLVARDQLGGQDVVVKRYLPGSLLSPKELERIIRLSQQLGDSGFLAAQDVVLEGGQLAGYTSKFIKSGSLSEIAGELDTVALFQVLESGRWIPRVIGSALTSVLTYLFFARLLQLNLPKGIIPFF